MEQKYVYFVSSYEEGDHFSEVFCMMDDFSEAFDFVSSNETDWIEGCYTHAIFWRLPMGAVYTRKLEVLGVYDVRNGEFIPSSLERREDSGTYTLTFGRNKLRIGRGSNAGPAFNHNIVKGEIPSDFKFE